MKIKIKEILNRLNLFRKISCISIAIVVYIVIYNIYDPIITIKIDNIAVAIENEEVITSLNKIYEIDRNKTFSIYVKGKQSLVKNLTKDDIKAIANLENLSIANSVAIDVTIPKLKNEDNIEITFSDSNTIHLLIDNYVTKSFAINIIKENDLNPNYYIFNNNINKKLKISGPQEKIKQIEKAIINVDLKAIKPGFKETYEIKLYDSFLNEISIEDLELNFKEYTYEPTIYNIEEIPLNINFIGSIPFGYSLVSSEYNPKTIKIAANKINLEKYKEININYDISNLIESKEVLIDLYDYLPKEIILVENINPKIDIKVDKLILKEFKFTTKDLSIKNLDENITYKYLSNDEYYLTLMGESKILENLTIDKIAPYIDVNNNKQGTYTLLVKIPETLNLQLMSKNKIEILLLEIIEPEEELEEEIIEEKPKEEIEENKDINDSNSNENIEEKLNEIIED